MSGWSWPGLRQRDGWFRIGQLDVTTTVALIAAGIVSMFLHAFDRVLTAKLAYVGPLVREGEVWRLVTWPLYNPPDEIWVVLTFAFFWFVGHAIEDRLGRVAYTLLILAMTVVPAAVTTLFRFTANTGIAFGLGLLGTGLLVLFAASMPHVPFFFGIPAWVVAAVFVAIDVLKLLGDRVWGRLALLAGVILVALIGGRMTGLVEVPERAPRPRRTAARSGARTPGGGVIRGPWGDAPATEPPRPAERLRATDQAALDRLLDKIASGGMDALSADERDELNDLSRRLRGS